METTSVNIQERKAEIASLLQDKEYRDAFVEASITVGVPSQIRELRKQRGWTQKELAERAEMLQESISRLEDPTRGSVNLKTLLKLASGFDVGVIVRFISFGEMADWKLKLSPEFLRAASFENDSYFKGQADDMINQAKMTLKDPPQQEPSIYLIYDSTRRKDPSPDELYATKKQESIAMMGVGR